MQVCVYARSNVAACMHACMHAWMDGWMDGWMYVCMFNVCNICQHLGTFLQSAMICRAVRSTCISALQNAEIGT